MSETQTPETRQKKGFPVRWVLLLVLLGALAAFGWLNSAPVDVRPFGRAPLYQILIAPLLVGVLLGWALRARVGRRSAQRAQQDKTGAA